MFLLLLKKACMPATYSKNIYLHDYIGFSNCKIKYNNSKTSPNKSTVP